MHKKTSRLKYANRFYIERLKQDCSDIYREILKTMEHH